MKNKKITIDAKEIEAYLKRFPDKYATLAEKWSLLLAAAHGARSVSKDKVNAGEHEFIQDFSVCEFTDGSILLIKTDAEMRVYKSRRSLARQEGTSYGEDFDGVTRDPKQRSK